MENLLYQVERTEALPGKKAQAFCFPGRWISGISLIAAPLTLLAGVLLAFHFFRSNRSWQIVAVYTLLTAGTVLLCPAVIALTHHIGKKHRRWMHWGSTLALIGLFAHTILTSASQFASPFAKASGIHAAAIIIAQLYNSVYIFPVLTIVFLLGWVLLAIGAFRSGTMGVTRSIALALMAVMPLGTLTGITPFSVVAAAGLCFALVPLGVDELLSKRQIA